MVCLNMRICDSFFNNIATANISKVRIFIHVSFCLNYRTNPSSDALHARRSRPCQKSWANFALLCIHLLPDDALGSKTMRNSVWYIWGDSGRARISGEGL